MRHYLTSYVLIHVAIAISLIWVAGLIVRLYRLRSHAFEQSWIVFPIVTCMALNAAQHVGMAVHAFHRLALPLLIIQGMYAAACVVSALAGRMILNKLMKSPSPKELKKTNDALATTISHLTEGK